MFPDPFTELGSGRFASCDIQNSLLLFINRGAYLIAIEHKEYFHCSMPDPLVAIKKWMILNQGMTQCGRFFRNIGIQILTSKGHLGLRDGRFQSASVPET